MLSGKTHHMLTPEGIEAARQGRARREAARPDVRAPQVFVVRLGVGTRYGWEVRRFGTIILVRSAETFGSPMLAKAAGQIALAGLSAEAEVSTS